MAVPGCSLGEDEAPPSHRDGEAAPPWRLDAVRLRQLGLTRGAPAQVVRACREARRLATVRVICPELIPDVPLSTIDGLDGGPIILVDERRFYMLEFNNAGGFGRPLRGVLHWIVGGGMAPIVDQWVLTDSMNDVKGEPKLVRQLNLAGRTVRVYRFPRYPAGSANGSHWAAFVRVGDELVFASLHGERYVDAAVEMALDLAEQAARSPGAPTEFPVVVHDFSITYCGVLSVSLNGEMWLVDSPRAGGSSDEPPRWRETGAGTFVILSSDRAEFRSRSGQVVSFTRADAGTADPSERCE
jgi:hypothetical protein